MNDEDRYLFDLQGYLLVEGAIAPDALTAMNAYIERQAETDPAWRGQPENKHLNNLLTWGPEFRNLLDNARVLPILTELLGDSLRLDHDYAMFLTEGHQGLNLHGGGTPYDPAQYYHCVNGKMFSGLTVVAYALTDVPPGMGGFACIPGSHKSNFRVPRDIVFLQRESSIVQTVPCKAGDAVIFTEALTHGTAPWKGAHPRRTLFYKFSPKHMSWSNQYYRPADGPSYLADIEPLLTEAQRVLLDPPSVYAHRALPQP